MLNFEDAYGKLSLCLRLKPSDVATRLKLDCALALACRRELCCLSEGISWDDLADAGKLLKERLEHYGYTAANLPQAAGVPSVLHLVSNRADALEATLKEKADMPLKELIRLFLLRRVLPLEQSIELLGAVVISTLLRLRALCCLESDFHLVNPEDAVKVIEELEGKTGEKRGFKIFSAVAWWPVEDLLIATDYGDTQHAAGEFEPVMYLSLDSYALISACPRDAVENVLDMCCGSGVQGLVALRHYARQATFLDVNPRALAFSRFNAALNGLHERCSFVEGSVHEDFLRHMGAKKFEVILANPPFVPNPDGTASAAGPLYSGGGHDGEEVHKISLQKGLTLLAAGGRFCSVAEVPNPESFPERVKEWVYQAGQPTGSIQIFTGKTIAAEEYWKAATQERSALEWNRYLSGLRRLGVSRVAEALVFLLQDGSPLSVDVITRSALWQDSEYLQTHVAHCMAS
ncbi:unnamed protein product [Durusdinium trenchii]